MDKNQASPIGTGTPYSGPYGPGCVGGISTAREVARETQVGGESSLLANALEETGRLAALIAERFSPILRAEPKLAEPSNKSDRAPEDYLVPLADSLRAKRKQVGNINSILSGILERAEL